MLLWRRKRSRRRLLRPLGIDLTEMELSREHVVRWAETHLRDGTQRSIVRRRLEEVRTSLESFCEGQGLGREPDLTDCVESAIETLDQVQEELRAQTVASINKAIRLEEDGSVDEAIVLYEGIVSEGYEGTLPYERVRILYAERKEYRKAIRACEAATRLLGDRESPLCCNQKHRDMLWDKLDPESTVVRAPVTQSWADDGYPMLWCPGCGGENREGHQHCAGCGASFLPASD